LKATPELTLQTASERDRLLASPATLSRFDNTAERSSARAIHDVPAADFIASHPEPPEELVLDFNAAADPVHGNQDGRFFHGCYDRSCFLPPYVFCGQQLRVSYLRPSNIDGAKQAWAISALLVRRLRQAWPKVRRGDGGFCRHRMSGRCELDINTSAVPCLF